MPSIDPTSAEIIVKYTGTNEQAAADAPARDLSENDVARLVYRRSLEPIVDLVGQPIVEGDSETYQRPDPRKPDPKVVAEVLAELELSGLYQVLDKSKKKNPEPAAPAQPEG